MERTGRWYGRESFWGECLALWECDQAHKKHNLQREFSEDTLMLQGDKEYQMLSPYRRLEIVRAHTHVIITALK